MDKININIKLVLFTFFLYSNNLLHKAKEKIDKNKNSQPFYDVSTKQNIRENGLAVKADYFLKDLI